MNAYVTIPIQPKYKGNKEGRERKARRDVVEERMMMTVIWRRDVA